MPRSIAVIGAPSSLGTRPYDDGEARHLDRAPRVLRERGLVARLSAVDMGDVVPPPYRDYARPVLRPRNEDQVIAYSRAIGARVAAAIKSGRFPLVAGGDCSIVLGSLLGARGAVRGPLGLAYADAHADFATPAESRTRSIAGMGLAFACGRGDGPLARLGGRSPLVAARRVALIGRRDGARTGHGHAALAASAVLDVRDEELLSHDADDLAAAILDRVAADAAGFWIHLDADVLNPALMPAVESPEPGGPMPDELVPLMRPLVEHPLALGLSVAVYDPALDPDRSAARRLVTLIERLLGAQAASRKLPSAACGADSGR
jgi:arginase